MLFPEIKKPHLASAILPFLITQILLSLDFHAEKIPTKNQKKNNDITTKTL